MLQSGNYMEEKIGPLISNVTMELPTTRNVPFLLSSLPPGCGLHPGEWADGGVRLQPATFNTAIGQRCAHFFVKDIWTLCIM